MHRHPRPLLLSLLCLGAFSAGEADANWQRQTVQQIQQTTASTLQQAEFRRSTLSAVAATGITASAPLLQQGQWNSAVDYSPTSTGGVFSLLLTNEPADPEPPSSLEALTAPASRRSQSVAPNRLQAQVQPDGSLTAGPGSSASTLQLTVTQTYSVFQ